MKDPKREVWLLVEADQIVTGIHPKEWCSGSCVVHSPSIHSLRDASLAFDVKKKSFYRTCEHGAQHQDPDERTYWMYKLEFGGDTGTAKRLAVMAMEKLSDWLCPTCECGCCEQ